MDTIRLFTYWKDNKQERNDLDLSVILLDEQFSNLWHVSYTRLEDKSWIKHSGDITSAPYWASEFIDINIKEIKEKNKKLRYIATQIYDFTGNWFSSGTMEKAYTWWMFRKDTDNNFKTFDIKTVKNKIDINWNWWYYIPIIIDLENKEIIYVDLFINWSSFSGNNVEWSLQNSSVITEEILNFRQTKPNMLDLFKYYFENDKYNIVSKKEIDEETLTIWIKNTNKINLTNYNNIISKLI